MTATRSTPRTSPVARSTPLAVVTAAVGAAVFVTGLLVASGAESHSALGFQRDPVLAGVAVVAALLGRVAMVVFQVEAVAVARRDVSGADKVALLRAVAYAQWPLAVRDLGLGALCLSHVLSADRALTLAASLVDPFLVWSCLLFYRDARSQEDSVPAARRTTAVYAGFLLVAKLVTGALAALLMHTGGV